MTDRPDACPPADRLASALTIDSIERKRRGETLSADHLLQLVGHFVAGRVPDYQAAAWLATVACMGLEAEEVLSLTRAYAAGGPVGRIGRIGEIVVDKHSTGGVGDKTTLVVVPMVAACGIPFAKMSGRGLGFAGGTVDKLESIAGLRMELERPHAAAILNEVGMVIAGQSATLAPGDATTYRLRDVTGTVDSIPLIAASILSKKVAFGPDLLVLDVKVGSGAMTPKPEDAWTLARLMEAVARLCGIRATAILSDMSQPLGYAAGNALEVAEAMRALEGQHIPALSELCNHLAAKIIRLARPGLGHDEAEQQARASLESGAALEIFLKWASAQGAEAGALDRIRKGPGAKRVSPLRASRSGWVHEVDPRLIGTAALHLGAGRLMQSDRIDPDAGITLGARVGDRVEAGDTIALLHGDHADHDLSAALAADAFRIEDAPPAPIALILDPETRPAPDAFRASESEL